MTIVGFKYKKEMTTLESKVSFQSYLLTNIAGLTSCGALRNEHPQPRFGFRVSLLITSAHMHVFSTTQETQESKVRWTLSSELSRYVPKVVPFRLGTLLVFFLTGREILLFTLNTQKMPPLPWLHAWVPPAVWEDSASESDANLQRSCLPSWVHFPYRTVRYCCRLCSTVCHLRKYLDVNPGSEQIMY